MQQPNSIGRKPLIVMSQVRIPSRPPLPDESPENETGRRVLGEEGITTVHTSKSTEVGHKSRNRVKITNGFLTIKN